MIKVYAMNVSELDVTDEGILSKMSQRRLEKISRLKVMRSKKQSIGAELLLNHVMRTEAGMEAPINWETDANGKLFVPGCDVCVNLSHSGEYAVCAVCDTDVGVDIERVKTADIKLARRFFTAEECDFVENAASADDAFSDIWVRKESFVKAVGKGLAIPLSSFSVLSETVVYEGRTYRFKKYGIRDKSYKLCVCFAV